MHRLRAVSLPAVHCLRLFFGSIMRYLPLALVLLSSPANAFILAQTFESYRVACSSSAWCKLSSAVHVGPWDLTSKTGRHIASSCASETALFGKSRISEEEMEGRKETLRTLLEASEEQMENLLRLCPSILYRRDVVKSYEPKLALLQKRLGMNRKDVTRLCLRSKILILSLENLESRFDWLKEELNLNDTQSRRFVKANRHLFGASREEDQRRLACIQDVLELDKDDKDALSKYISRTPQLLSYQPTELLRTRDWVKDRFNISNERIAKVCRHRPEILVSDVETLEEKAQWLKRTFQLTEEELSKAVSSYPHTLTYSIETKLQPMADFLKKTLECDPKCMKDVLRSCPALFSYSIKKNLEPKIELMEQRIRMKGAKGFFVQKSSLVLSKSLPNLIEPRLVEAERDIGITNWTPQKMSRLLQRSEAQWIKYRMDDIPRGRQRAG